MGKSFRDKKKHMKADSEKEKDFIPWNLRHPSDNKQRLQQWDEAYPKGTLRYDLVEEILEEDDETPTNE